VSLLQNNQNRKVGTWFEALSEVQDKACHQSGQHREDIMRNQAEIEDRYDVSLVRTMGAIVRLNPRRRIAGAQFTERFLTEEQPQIACESISKSWYACHEAVTIICQQSA
jgi:hypothetical protein